jgi:hypothetical protein
LNWDYTAIKAEYIADGKSSIRKLAKKYGIPYGTLNKRACSEKWKAQKDQSGEKTVAKAIKKIEDGRANRLLRLQTVTDKVLNKIEKAVETMADSDPELINPLAFKQITGALKDIKEIQMLRSDIDIREQEARIRNLEKQAEADENKDTTVIVQFDDDISRWSK